MHAPGGDRGPPIDARGASFVGINLYVQLGRGRDYAWSATSAGQDSTDTSSSAAGATTPGARRRRARTAPTRSRSSCATTRTTASGDCEPIEVLEKTVSWSPTLADQTPAGSQGFLDFNTPTAITGPESFAQAASKVGYTFNTFYADSERISYFNSGANPVRASRIDHDLPVAARHEWRGWDPERWRSQITPPAAHPQAIDQRFLVNWNNKQARGFASSDTNAYSSAYRSQMLSDRVRRAIRGDRRLTLPGLIDIMAVAGTGDLRAHSVLPLALRVVGRPRAARMRAAVATLRAWRSAGGLRKDGDRDGVYEHTDAVALMDAWWPRLLRAQFRPVLGANAMEKLEAALELDNAPNNHGEPSGVHIPGIVVRVRAQGPADGAGPQGSRPLRARVLRSRPLEALPPRAAALPPRGAGRAALRAVRRRRGLPRRGRDGDQWCFDALRQRPTGGATQPLIHWVNRPTYQQANEINGRVGR